MDSNTTISTPGLPEPTVGSRRTTDVRAALIEVAERVLERDGVAGLTVRAVAREAGVAPMGVYNHLQNKDGLLLAVLANGFARLAASAKWDDDLPAEQAMREMGWGYRRFALASPVVYGLMFGAGTRLADAVEQLGPRMEDAFVGLGAAVRAAQAAGTVHDGDAQDIAMTIWSAVHGAVGIEVSGAVPAGFDGAAAYSAVLDLIELGLAPRP